MPKPKIDPEAAGQCERAIVKVSKVTGITPAAIKGKSRDKDTVIARTLLVHTAHDHLGVMKARIKEYLGQTANAIYQTLLRARDYRATDKKYAKAYLAITGGL